MSVRCNCEGYEPEIIAPDFVPESEDFEYSYQSVLDPDFTPYARPTAEWKRFVEEAETVVSAETEPKRELKDKPLLRAVPLASATSSTRSVAHQTQNNQEVAEYLVIRAIAAIEHLCLMPTFFDTAVLFDSIERLEAATRAAKKRHGAARHATSSTRTKAARAKNKSASTTQLTLI